MAVNIRRTFEPTYMGHWIGHWEGDTLVVDTVGMRGDTVFDVTAAPHSDQIHVTERLRRLSATKLEDRFVVGGSGRFHPALAGGAYL